jgi:putative SbcD/Mre11-related phosphoesterase
MAAPRPPRLEVRPDVWIDGRLALWLAVPRVLVIADLHWGYAVSHRARGNLLPAWGDAEIAARLRSLIDDYQPREMIWLGDSLHTLEGRQTADEFLRTTSLPITLVSGNHDARWARIGGVTSLQRENFLLHHGDRVEEIPPGATEIVGHFHPALAWSDSAGTSLKVPALVVSERRLVLPAFSPWSAGSPWPLGKSDEVVYGIGTKRIFTVSPSVHQKEPFVS